MTFALEMEEEEKKHNYTSILEEKKEHPFLVLNKGNI